MCQSIECYAIIIDVMIYVSFINPFIRRDRDMTLYFNIPHYWCNAICILGNSLQFVHEADDLFTDTETILEESGLI
jgi:hypothetical protein